MAGRGPQSFKKRQKEQARKEKQQDKAARRVQRKADKDNPDSVEVESDELVVTGADELSADEIADRLVGLRVER
jgi:hypothetical protein